MSETKDDFIGKRVNDVRKIFGLAERDFMALMLVISLIGNVLLVWMLLSQNKSFSDQLVEEVRKQVKPAVQQEVKTELPVKLEEAVQPMKDGVKQATDKVDTILQKINR